MEGINMLKAPFELTNAGSTNNYSDRHSKTHPLMDKANSWSRRCIITGQYDTAKQVRIKPRFIYLTKKDKVKI
ncbi:hypothetical protein Hanom_Chr03g00200061 [Helianthus anomalus]